MPNPQRRISYLSLAGAVIALSALRAGARVQVTLWSGKQQCMHTPGFVRDEQAILRTLTGFYGGATAFPIHRLRDTYLGARRERPAHLLMISDDGITTMFEQDEHGNDGWDVSAQALAVAGGGGSMALQLPSDWDGGPAYRRTGSRSPRCSCAARAANKAGTSPPSPTCRTSSTSRAASRAGTTHERCPPWHAGLR